MRKTRSIVLTGLMIAIGLAIVTVLKNFGGQQINIMFSPMHFPVLIAGLAIGPAEGLVTGVVTPILSYLIKVPEYDLTFYLAAVYGHIGGDELTAGGGGRHIYGIAVPGDEGLYLELYGTSIGPVGIEIFGTAVRDHQIYHTL